MDAGDSAAPIAATPLAACGAGRFALERRECAIPRSDGVGDHYAYC